MPVAFLGCLPSFHQQRNLLITSDEGRQPRAIHGFESPLHRARSYHPPRLHRLRDTLQAVIAQVFVFELAGPEIVRARCHHDRIRRCDPLQTGGKIRRLADYGALLGSAFSDNVTDDDRARRNAYPYRELDHVPGAAVHIEVRDRADQLQAGVN